MYKLAPSMLSANFAKLEEEISIIESAGAHYLHIDVMDGHFVPNISFGVPVIKSIRAVTNMTFDVHLMVTEPEKYIETFADAGADIINVHVEATEKLEECINKIKNYNKRAAVTVKPATAIESIYDVIGELDMILIMSVEPGRGGQELIKDTLVKAEKLANYISNNKLLIDIEMDGGIYLENVKDVLNAGVNVVVAGSAVFAAEDKNQAVKDFYQTFKEFGDSK